MADRRIMTKLRREIKELLVPHCVTCSACGREISENIDDIGLCGPCLGGMVRVEGSGYLKGTSSIRCIWTLRYTDGVKTGIHRMKYSNARHWAVTFARLMAGELIRRGETADVIVPVPLHPKRLRKRGYNQSALIARELSYIMNIPVNETALVRVKNTRSQVSLEGEERRREVRHAFELREELTDKRVWILDDVMTTGATLYEAAICLQGRCASVTAVAVTHAE